MSYSVIKCNTTKNRFNIVEKDTKTTINLLTSQKCARIICRKLNLGSGFNGFTPDFFAKLKGKDLKG